MTTTSASASAGPDEAPRLDSDSVRHTTRRSGANRAASLDQFDTTLVGATTRNGGRPETTGRGRSVRALAASCPGPCRPPGCRPGETPEELQPAVSLELVRPEFGAQRLWNIDVLDR